MPSLIVETSEGPQKVHISHEFDAKEQRVFKILVHAGIELFHLISRSYSFEITYYDYFILAVHTFVFLFWSLIKNQLYNALIKHPEKTARKIGHKLNKAADVADEAVEHAEEHVAKAVDPETIEAKKEVVDPHKVEKLAAKNSRDLK